jgi:hypothetical protein
MCHYRPPQRSADSQRFSMADGSAEGAERTSRIPYATFLPVAVCMNVWNSCKHG